MSDESDDIPEKLRTLRAKKVKFLSALRITGNITKACEAAGCSRTAHYYWEAHDPEYPKEFEEAQEEARERLEVAARERAEQGLRRIKFDKNGDPLIDPHTGEPYTEHVYSDTLAIFLLKGMWPEKYGDKNETTVKGGLNIDAKVGPSIDWSRYSDEELEALQRLLNKGREKALPAPKDDNLATLPTGPVRVVSDILDTDPCLDAENEGARTDAQ